MVLDERVAPSIGDIAVACRVGMQAIVKIIWIPKRLIWINEDDVILGASGGGHLLGDK